MDTRLWKRIRVFTAGLAAMAAAFVLAPSDVASIRADRMAGPMDVLVAAPGDANYVYGLSPRQMSALGTTPNLVTITVDYDAGFQANPQAQAAFQAAIDIWSNIITSSVPIKVKASYIPLATGVLGQAGPTLICRNFSGAPVTNTWYAAALANKLAGSNFCVDADGYHITASFSSSFLNWDFGTSGVPQTGKYNFLTVVMHEIGHGLGFFGSGDRDNTTGQGFWGETVGVPDIYDRFVFNGSGLPIIGFVDGSIALGSELIGNNLFFDGSNTRAQNGGNKAKIESSLNPFRPGSSYSHLDDVTYTSTPNGLMTFQLNTAEVYTDPGPIVRGVFLDEGWTVGPPPCTYSISPTAGFISLAGGTGTVSVTAGAGCAWTATSSTAGFTVTGGASGTGNGTVAYSVTASGVNRTGTFTIAGFTFTVTQTSSPIMTLTPSPVNFGVTNNAGTLQFATPAQTLTLTQAGAGGVTWTVSKDQPWITVSPTSGSGPATISVSINNAGFVLPATGQLNGTVTVNTTGAANSPAATINLTVLTPGQAAPALGFVDTPANGQSGITGSIAVTGWVIDDIGLSKIRVMRDGTAAEGGGFGNVVVGLGVRVAGARPDIAAFYPIKPFYNAAGWGYLLLTNMLPNQGNGTFTLRVFADDIDGHSTLIGSKTITCTNATATTPFGAIDTPDQGGTASGALVNFGWVLAGQPAASGRFIPFDGSTIEVWIDSVKIGLVDVYNAPRPDVQALFPTWANASGPLGGKTLNTAVLANGTHTIFWIAADNLGAAQGIGSRFFTVSNSSVLAGATTAVDADQTPSAPGLIDATPARVAAATTLEGIRASDSALAVRHGFDASALPELTMPDSGGVRQIRTAQLERVVVDLSAAADGDATTYRGYTKDGATLRALPIGSHLDAHTGEFAWAPGLAFGGSHDLVFVKTCAHGSERIDVRVSIDAQRTDEGEPRLVIDVPGSGAALDQPFAIAGWAIDPRGAANGAGIDTLHVWAYRVGSDGLRASASAKATADESGLGIAIQSSEATTSKAARSEATEPQRVAVGPHAPVKSDTPNAPIWIGAAMHGGARSDIADLFGPRFLHSGFSVTVAGLAPGTYDVVVYAHSTAANSFVIARTVRVTVK